MPPDTATEVTDASANVRLATVAACASSTCANVLIAPIMEVPRPSSTTPFSRSTRIALATVMQGGQESNARWSCAQMHRIALAMGLPVETELMGAVASARKATLERGVNSSFAVMKTTAATMATQPGLHPAPMSQAAPVPTAHANVIRVGLVDNVKFSLAPPSGIVVEKVTPLVSTALAHANVKKVTWEPSVSWKCVHGRTAMNMESHLETSRTVYATVRLVGLESFVEHQSPPPPLP